MKRSHASHSEAQAPENEDSERSEMEVEDESKADQAEIEGSDEDAPPAAMSMGEASPFLDAFYGLSSNNARERSQAAQAILHHCLTGPEANTKDAAYALNRLLNGLCSGRAAARQGNASALSSFLQLAGPTLQAIQREKTKNSDGDTLVSDLKYVQERLFQATKVVDGKKRAAEERDYQFGRLFGILSVARSSMLSIDDNTDMGELQDVASDYVIALAELYRAKQWMREPAAHAVGTLLSLYYDAAPNSNSAISLVNHLVRRVVAPELLAQGDYASVEVGDDSTVAAYSTEQIAMILNIQAHGELHDEKFSGILSETILSSESIAKIATKLAETSAVAQPRLHLVWETIFQCVTAPTDRSDGNEDAPNATVRLSRDFIPASPSSVSDVLGAIMRFVVLEKLLGFEEGHDDSSKNAIKATHERRALALAIVRTLCGVSFVSSVSGRSTLRFSDDIVEHVVLQPAVAQRLFVDVIGAGKSGKRKQGEHMLKPMATQVLESIITSATMPRNDMPKLRAALARALLRCDPRFDAKTKSRTVLSLLGVVDGRSGDTDFQLMPDMLVFVQGMVTDTLLTGANDEATQLVEIVFKIGKRMAQLDQFFLFGRCVAILAAFAFCFSIEESGKERSKKGSDDTERASCPVGEIMGQIDGALGTMDLPLYFRETCLSRMYSLLAEVTTSHTIKPDDHSRNILNVTSSLYLGVQSVAPRETRSIDTFQPFSHDRGTEEATGKDLHKDRLLRYLEVMLNIIGIKMVECRVLSIVMREAGDDGEPHEAIDSKELMDMAEDVTSLAGFVRANPLAVPTFLKDLSNLCVEILRSRFCTGTATLGAMPRLLRDLVRQIWIDGLWTAARDPSGGAIDRETLMMLLKYLGSSIDEDLTSSDASVVSGSDEESSVSSHGSTSGVKNVPDNAKDDDSEVQIDPSQLQTMLENDDESVIGELEHHAGADKALAALIKTKQDARKTGQRKVEREICSQEIKCSMLLELLLQGKPDGWGSLLRCNTVISTLLPLIRQRRELERGLGASGQVNTLTGEKKDLFDKVTQIVKSKLLKVKIHELRWSPECDERKVVTDIIEKLASMVAVSHTSKDHQLICASSIPFLLRSLTSDETRCDIAASTYDKLVTEWSSRKTTGINVSVFDEFTHHLPLTALVVLLIPLLRAVRDARSSFLKAEAFRLLSQLFNMQGFDPGNALHQKARDIYAKNGDGIFSTASKALRDPDLTKAKRARDILKNLAKILTFVDANADDFVVGKDSENGLFVAVEETKASSESHAVATGCDKILHSLTDLSTKLESARASREAAIRADGAEFLSVSKKKKKSKKTKNK